MNIAPSEELDARERLRMLVDACGVDPAVQWPRIALECWDRAEKERKEWRAAAEALGELVKQGRDVVERMERMEGGQS